MDPDRIPMVSGEDSSTADIEILGATTWDDLLACDENIETLTLPIGECSVQLGPTIKVTTFDNPGEIETINPKCWTRE